MASKGGGRCSKLNLDVFKEKDCNGDFISIWCIAGKKPEEAICTICNTTINCTHHGSSAVKRHAGNKKHIDDCNKNRNKDGVLMKPSQKRIEFVDKKGIQYELTHAEKVSAAEVQFAVALATKGIQYAFSDVATMLFPKMFTDSKIAKDFTCCKTKASYLISDGLGPHFKENLLNEIRNNEVFYSLIVDETPLPEKRCQQFDLLIRFYSNFDGRVTTQHLQSSHIGHGTADVMFDVVNNVLEELPKDKLLCFFSDGPNVMKRLKTKVKDLNDKMLDIPTCCLHKVHNSFSTALSAFGDDVELLIIDLYYYFKHSSAKSDDFRSLQSQLDLPEKVLVKHCSSRWLTLEHSITRFLEMFDLIITFFKNNKSSRDSVRHKRIQQALKDNLLLPKALFIKNVSGVLNAFLEPFQTEAPLVHILYDEMYILLKTLLGRFLKSDVNADGKNIADNTTEDKKSILSLKGPQLKLIDVEKGVLWKSDSTIDIGMDTTNAMKGLSSSERNTMLKGARAFYIACTKKLLKTLPLDNKLLSHLQVLHPIMKKEETSLKSIKYLGLNTPTVISPAEVSLLQDEWNRVRAEPDVANDKDQYVRIDDYWKHYFLMKDNFGNTKFPLITKLFKAILCVPHGSADVERGFSINKNILENRSNLTEASVNGLRQVISHVKRIGGLENFTVDRATIKVARAAYKNYSSRLERQKEQEAKKKRKEPDSRSSEEEELKALETVLEKKVKASQELLETAEKNISEGLKKKNMFMIENGHKLLSEAKSTIATNLTELEETRKKLSLLKPSKKCKK